MSLLSVLVVPALLVAALTAWVLGRRGQAAPVKPSI